MKTYVGEIVEFKGSWSSGIATLIIKNSKGETHNILCENTPTVRKLDSTFGDIITNDHCVNNSILKGKMIEFVLDNGILAAFNPIGDEYEDI